MCLVAHLFQLIPPYWFEFLHFWVFLLLDITSYPTKKWIKNSWKYYFSDWYMHWHRADMSITWNRDITTISSLFSNRSPLFQMSDYTFRNKTSLYVVRDGGIFRSKRWSPFFFWSFVEKMNVNSKNRNTCVMMIWQYHVNPHTCISVKPVGVP